MVHTITLSSEGVSILDQRLLPQQVEFIQTKDYRVVADAIKTLAVRGAPAIGIAAAFGIVLAARQSVQGNIKQAIKDAAADLGATRPTAVNLFWAIERMTGIADAAYGTNEELVARLEVEALQIYEQDIADNKCMGALGADLFPDNARVLTHCNAGALATGGYGTALGVVRAAHERGLLKMVFADETRPLLQGARLTAWELIEDGINVTVITDGMAGHVMAKNMVDLVIVGADRIAANGDTANKIGTYGTAVLARAHNIPFYVAAPTSTIDMSLSSGDMIPIEERGADEVSVIAGSRVAPEGAQVFNPAFDVTPSQYITAIITERAVLRPPFGENLNRLFVEK